MASTTHCHSVNEMPHVHIVGKNQSEKLGKCSQIRRCQSWLGKLLRCLRYWDSNLVNYPYTVSLLFKLLPQQQAGTTDKDIMLCYTRPQTTIFIILHTVPDPIFFPGIWCPNQGYIQATNLFTSLRRVFFCRLIA